MPCVITSIDDKNKSTLVVSNYKENQVNRRTVAFDHYFNDNQVDMNSHYFRYCEFVNYKHNMYARKMTFSIRDGFRTCL